MKQVNNRFCLLEQTGLIQYQLSYHHRIKKAISFPLKWQRYLSLLVVTQLQIRQTRKIGDPSRDTLFLLQCLCSKKMCYYLRLCFIWCYKKILNESSENIFSLLNNIQAIKIEEEEIMSNVASGFLKFITPFSNNICVATNPNCIYRNQHL